MKIREREREKKIKERKTRIKKKLSFLYIRNYQREREFSQIFDFISFENSKQLNKLTLEICNKKKRRRNMIVTLN